MKYPKECPVFEVLNGGDCTNAGTIVEAFAVKGFSVLGRKATVYPGELGVRLVDDSDRLGGISNTSKILLGFYGYAQTADELRPLTPAARAMLAIAKAATK